MPYYEFQNIEGKPFKVKAYLYCKLGEILKFLFVRFRVYLDFNNGYIILLTLINSKVSSPEWIFKNFLLKK